MAIPGGLANRMAFREMGESQEIQVILRLVRAPTCTQSQPPNTTILASVILVLTARQSPAQAHFTVCFAGDANSVAQKWHHGMNIAYTDGHVQFMTQAQLRSLGTTTPFAGYENGAAVS